MADDVVGHRLAGGSEGGPRRVVQRVVKVEQPDAAVAAAPAHRRAPPACTGKDRVNAQAVDAARQRLPERMFCPAKRPARSCRRSMACGMSVGRGDGCMAGECRQAAAVPARTRGGRLRPVARAGRCRRRATSAACAAFRRRRRPTRRSGGAGTQQQGAIEMAQIRRTASTGRVAGTPARSCRPAGPATAAGRRAAARRCGCRPACWPSRRCSCSASTTSSTAPSSALRSAPRCGMRRRAARSLQTGGLRPVAWECSVMPGAGVHSACRPTPVGSATGGRQPAAERASCRGLPGWR